MSTIEIIKTACPYVTAIVSLIVAFTVVILNYRIQLKMRKEAYRQEIYKRMVTAYEEIYSHAVEIHESYSKIPTDIQSHLAYPSAELIAIRQKHIMYLSSSVDKTINNLIKFHHESNQKRLELLNRLADAMKEHLGTKSLLEGLPEIFGVKIRSE